MSALYCQNCGTKIEFTLNKPSACFKCGNILSKGLNINREKSSISTSEKSKINREEVYEDYENDIIISEDEDLKSHIKVDVSSYESSVGAVYRF